jgi:2-polyprenyl-3-methyl-5-hydroxy-6-metoxy-1,4-benzoquinol methylase
VLDLDFPRCVANEFPEAFPYAWRATELVLPTCVDVDLAALERRSPALRGFDWECYLRCSVVRMAQALNALFKLGLRTGRLLDFGSYFGNFALMCANAGFQVDALDSYRTYGAALRKASQLLQDSGVRVIDFEDVGVDLQRLEPNTYDIVLCMGVIEHIPHTPRLVLQAINRVLRPNGLLLIDTPNLAYQANRLKLARGESIFCPITAQFNTELPFEGHHREYTGPELTWMLQQLGHEVLSTIWFNYSLYQSGSLSGTDLVNHRIMQANPSARELLLSVSRKPPC